MSNQNVVRAAYYLRISTEEQELDNQRAEIIPFIERRGWKLVHPFEDVMSAGTSRGTVERKMQLHSPARSEACSMRETK